MYHVHWVEWSNCKAFIALVNINVITSYSHMKFFHYSILIIIFMTEYLYTFRHFHVTLFWCWLFRSTESPSYEWFLFLVWMDKIDLCWCVVDNSLTWILWYFKICWILIIFSIINFFTFSQSHLCSYLFRFIDKEKTV